MKRIVVLDDYQAVAERWAPWSTLGASYACTFFHDHLEGAALAAAIGDADVIVAMRERTAIDRALLESLGALELVVTTGMANAAIDTAFAASRGIPTCGTSSGAATTTELTWALLLAAVKHLPQQDAALRRGAWQTQVAGNLERRTLGLIGLGRLGAAMVPIARAFGMEVVAWSQNLRPERAADLGVEPLAMEELLRCADVVSIHLRLSERTHHLLGQEELAAMKPGAILVNTSRGPIVDEVALVDALQSHTIAGAALDVYDVEPLPADHPLLACSTAVLAPHLGYASEDNLRLMYTEAVEDIAHFYAGEPIRIIAQ